jgi:acyl-CoA synthetase (AMP-forming)/AMP-acid ligase II
MPCFDSKEKDTYRKRTLVDFLRQRATEQPDDIAFTFLPDGEGEENNVTYAQLDSRAQSIGVRLRANLVPGDRALLSYPMGLEFIAAFFGCLYAGVIAIPSYFPDAGSLDSTLRQLTLVVQDAEPKVMLTTSPSLKSIENVIDHYKEVGAVRGIATETIPHELAKNWRYPSIDSDTLALLQYTSGSTSAPKGVMVRHCSILWRASQEEAPSPKSASLSWRPLMYTGGLYMGVLLPVVLGVRGILMPPETLLQKPLKWLETISRYKVASSAGPNFAYDHCVTRTNPEMRAGLDLTCWKAAFVVGEHIDAMVLERFAATFRPYGFQREAFVPCYGLTEMTGLISRASTSGGLRILRADKTALERNTVIVDPPADSATHDIVSSGSIVTQKVTIVDPTTREECQPNKVGEIWASCEHAPRGYWNKSDETERTFRAFLANSHEGPFLRTGDLGFIHNKELFVTGRLKDLIIVRGRNIYPQDVELTISQSGALSDPGSVVVFSIPNGTEERVVVVQELKGMHPESDLDDIVETIRRTVFEEHGVLAYVVLLVNRGAIPKSSIAGKSQRSACRSAFIEGTLQAVKTSLMGDDYPDYRRGPRVIAPRTPTEKKLAEIWQAILKVDRIGIYDNFVDLGGHSILATQCLNRMRGCFGIDLPPTALFTESANIRELAETIDDMASKRYI